MHFRIAALASCVLLGSAARMPAQCLPDWGNELLPPAGIDGYVSAILSVDLGDGSVLFAGGNELSINTRPLHNLASFDGVEWSEPGGGVEGTINAMVSFDDGSGNGLFVAGSIYSAGGERVQGMAFWNGHVWKSVSGPPGLVTAMAEHNDGAGDKLYAAATVNLSTNTSNVFKWNGVGWEILGSSFNNRIFTLCSFDDGLGKTLFAAGSFRRFNGLGQNAIARWNGTDWVAVAGQVPHDPLTVGGSIRALLPFDDGTGTRLYAAGGFSWSGPIPLYNIACWNGSDWLPVATGLNGSVNALTTFDNGNGPRLHAGGAIQIPGGASNSYVVRLDGSIWSPVGSNPPGLPTAFATLNLSDRSVLCASMSNHRGVVRLQADTWLSLVPPFRGGVSTYPGNGTVEAQVAFNDGHGDSLYVAGRFAFAGGAQMRNIARWNGSDFTALGSGVSGAVYAMTVFDDGTGSSIYVGGNFDSAGGIPATNIARWDGSSWWPVGDGVDGAIAALEVYDDGTGPALYAAGIFQTAGSVETRNIARWNGSSWSAVGGGTDDTVGCLKSFTDKSGSYLYAGGWFYTAGNVDARAIARWNGTTWSPVGDGLAAPQDGGVSCLFVANDATGPALYVSGYFRTLGKISTRNIVRWDGAAWSPLADGLGDYGARSLAWFDDGTGPALYAGGYFEAAGAVSASRLARWDGQCWHPVGRGLYFNYDDPFFGYISVNSLLPFDDGHGPALFVAGHFTAIDDRSFSNIARLERAAPSTPQVIESTGDQLVCGGDAVHLSVNATGDTPLEFQWQRRGSDLVEGEAFSGTKSPALTISSAQPGSWDDYRCRISNSTCQVYSAPAFVFAATHSPHITMQPASRSVVVGGSVVFSLNLDAGDGYTIQWRRNGIPLRDSAKIRGSATDAITVQDATRTDAGTYDAIVTNGCGSATSSPARLSVYSIVSTPVEEFEVQPAKHR